MSANEDCELQDLVKQTLERTGSLSKIRAELRASIFLALEENGSFQSINSKDSELQKFSQSTDGALILCLMKEFLEYFGLSFTMSVLDPELTSYSVQCTWKNRKELIKQLNLPSDLDNEKKSPLMYHVLQQFRNEQNNIPSSIPQSSNNEKEVTHLPTSRLIDTLTKEAVLPSAITCSKESNSTIEKSDEKTEEVETMPSETDVEWTCAASSIVNGNDSFITDLSKPNLTLLGDLPPLSSPANSAKASLSPSSKSSKQMSKLKAMLIDSTYETNNLSNMMDDDEWANSIENHDDISELDDLDEKQIQELLKE